MQEKVAANGSVVETDVGEKARSGEEEDEISALVSIFLSFAVCILVIIIRNGNGVQIFPSTRAWFILQFVFAPWFLILSVFSMSRRNLYSFNDWVVKN
jgi:hypothetical protein